jgi:hypothetical protein
MLNLPAGVYRRAQSAAWINPRGEFEPVPDEMMHDNMSSFFPGMPADENYPSNFAVEKLGYMKVSNPFEFVWGGSRKNHRGRPIDVDAQFETMVDYTVGAIVSYKTTRSTPHWIGERGDPTEWEVRTLQPGRPIMRTTVGDFVERYGSSEAADRLYSTLGLNERRLRSLVREILGEGTPLLPRFMDDGDRLLLPGWTGWKP